jgi:hypothetical protein
LRTWIDFLSSDHRRLEQAIEGLLGLLTGGAPGIGEALAAARTAAAAHYRREAPFLAAIRAHSPDVAAKLESQHAEAGEAAAEAARSLGEGQARDATSLARRFCAVAQHNIIEEERDVFPLAVRWLAGAEAARLSATLAPDYHQD